jgi:ATP-dependent DNA helicase RecG
MDCEDVIALIDEIRRLGSELDDVEAKAAQGGLPERIYRSLSALSNRRGGGVILFGVDEEQHFAVVGVSDVARLQQELASVASEMRPPLRLDFDVCQVEGQRVVAVTVPECPPDQKPCYWGRSRLEEGAYVRVGATNRRMTVNEIRRLWASYRDDVDAEVVPDASPEDLDWRRVEAYRAEVLRRNPESAAAEQTLEQLLLGVHCLAQDGGLLRPTLAGLLLFSRNPQYYCPRFIITITQYTGTEIGQEIIHGRPYLFDAEAQGPIPAMIDKAERTVLGLIKRRAYFDGLTRREVPEYPEFAIREAIRNAVAHRDYTARGSHIDVRLFADRLEVRNPGGLFGDLTVEILDEAPPSTRNPNIMRVLQDLGYVEQRGTGIRRMIAEMRQINLEPPHFKDAGTYFVVRLKNHTLLDEETLAWLNQFADYPLNDRQRLALAYLRVNAQMTNADYRRLHHGIVETVEATRELRGLVETGLVEMHGTRRWAYYTLSEQVTARVQLPLPLVMSDEEKILAYVREHGSIRNAECRELLGLGDDTERARYILGKLVAAGELMQIGQKRGTRYILPNGDISGTYPEDSG